MTDFSRYAVYYLPPEGALARFGAQWLGWDVAAGAPLEQPALEGIAEITAAPRKYGFHATLKPPFRLADKCDLAGLERAVSAVARQVAPVALEGLVLARLGRFLALVPEGDVSALEGLAARFVCELDAFRAPLSEADLARRRRSRLSARQKELLAVWGYPFVLEEFRFHMTLTGPLDPAQVARVEAWVRAHVPVTPRPCLLTEVALVGETQDGTFHLIRRFPLGGCDQSAPNPC